ncbi:hypothetical protein EVA_16068 [gut metagenome]|uniref:Major fimbrial subunit protein N-terminal domain-containing protein n=1 Tax=gut metagenome TaxID=749906 RepID=J9FMZ2_9ZZZZ
MKQAILPHLYIQRNLRFFLFLLWALTLVSCETTCEECEKCEECEEGEEQQGGNPTRLTFYVVSQSTQSGQSQSEAADLEERKIRTIYIYAFDDHHTFPDFFEDPFVNHGYGVDGVYRVNMDIHGTGQKRFYLIANPPKYIQTQLTHRISEGTLRSMIFCMQQPIQQLSQIPQNADGTLNTSKENTGFPLSNQLTGYIHRYSNREGLYLTHEDNPGSTAITTLPLFRALGKISVYAYRETAAPQPTVGGTPAPQENVTITNLEIFNYTCDGYFIPRRTPGGLLDLEAMSKKEVKVGIQPVPLLKEPITVTSNYTSRNQLRLTYFYVCQNSYGKAIEGEINPGVPDTEGNRTTKMVINLSDGRRSEISLPYLRRNDHLHIRIGISLNVIKIEFEEWNLNTVTPDWDDGLDPNKHPQTNQ